MGFVSNFDRVKINIFIIKATVYLNHNNEHLSTNFHKNQEIFSGDEN